MSNSIDLGVNIDHVATLREARGTRYPDPLQAAFLAEQAGAAAITVHLREDRRHIQERDVQVLCDRVVTRVNLEMAVTEEMIAFALAVQPQDVCLVPEKREELTTEGGLDVCGQLSSVSNAVARLSDAGIRVSLFIDPEPKQVAAAVDSKAPVIELHTGAYADAQGQHATASELARVGKASEVAFQEGLQVNAGHGLNYHNVQPIAAISVIRELNIGHAIVARAVMGGFFDAVKEMNELMQAARRR